jgi:hypothetical protein
MDFELNGIARLQLSPGHNDQSPPWKHYRDMPRVLNMSA